MRYSTKVNTGIQRDPFKPWVYRHPDENGEYVLTLSALFTFRTFEDAVEFIEVMGVPPEWEIYNVNTGERTPITILQR